MTIIESTVSAQSAGFATNRQDMLAALGQVRAVEDKVRATEEIGRAHV